MEELGRKSAKAPQQSISRNSVQLLGAGEEHIAVTSWEKASGIVVDPVLWIGETSNRSSPGVRASAMANQGQWKLDAAGRPPLLPHEQLIALQAGHRIDGETRLFDGPNYISSNWGSHVVAPRFYACSFCAREFGSAQALGGHMNVHRHERAHLVAIAAAATESSDDHERVANDAVRYDSINTLTSPWISGHPHPHPYPISSSSSSSSSSTSPPPTLPYLLPPSNQINPYNPIYPSLTIHPPAPAPPTLDLDLHLGRMPAARPQQ